MRAMLGLVIAMGVLIIIGTAVVAVTIIHRMAPNASHTQLNATLDEPPGTHIIGATTLGDRLAIILQGGGPDRILLLDPTTAHPIGTIRLK